MALTGAPPLNPASAAPLNSPTAGQPGTAPGSLAASGAGVGTAPTAGAPPPADQVDIKALNLAAALQILITELAAELALPAGALPAQTPAQAAKALVQLFLQAVPDPAGEAPALDSANHPAAAAAGAQAEPSATTAEIAFQSALDRAVGIVAAWRNVPLAVVDGAAQTRTLAMSLLSEEPPSPLWLAPEWLGLRPAMNGYWRRRRRRGHLADPDAHPRQEPSSDDGDTRPGRKPT